MCVCVAVWEVDGLFQCKPYNYKENGGVHDYCYPYQTRHFSNLYKCSNNHINTNCTNIPNESTTNTLTKHIYMNIVQQSFHLLCTGDRKTCGKFDSVVIKKHTRKPTTFPKPQYGRKAIINTNSRDPPTIYMGFVSGVKQIE